MTRSHCRLWTHAVFVTKNREQSIVRKAEDEIYNHLYEQLRRRECVPLIINGMPNHVHLLYLSNYKIAPMEIFQKVKGETSFWINKNKVLPTHFSWQDGSYSTSVGEKEVAAVKNYIANQKMHHAKKSFQEECDDFFRDYDAD
jgi:putative transposase